MKLVEFAVLAALLLTVSLAFAEELKSKALNKLRRTVFEMGVFLSRTLNIAKVRLSQMSRIRVFWGSLSVVVSWLLCLEIGS